MTPNSVVLSFLFFLYSDSNMTMIFNFFGKAILKSIFHWNFESNNLAVQILPAIKILISLLKYLLFDCV